MASLTVGQASKLVGCGKSTITRAIKAGRLSASRRDDGSYSIDPAELSRVYTIQKEVAETVAATRSMVHRATPTEPSTTSDETPALRAQIDGLKALVDEMRSSRDHSRDEACRWREQAERLTMAIALKPESAPEQETKSARPWWKRLAG